MTKKTNFIKGFTLIELLVVMSIIAILASIMYGPFQTARRRARDTQTIQDLRTIQNYLALYADDNLGVYPTSLSSLTSYGTLPSRINIGTAKDFNKYNYAPITSGGAITGYHLWAHLSDTNDALRSDRDCDSLVPTSCWDSAATANTTFGIKGGTVPAPSTDPSGDGTASAAPSVEVCKTLTNCILDYTN